MVKRLALFSERWFLIVTGWLFLTYLTFAQLIPAFDYDFGVATGTQEPA